MYFLFLFLHLSAHARTMMAEDYYITAFNEMSDMLAGRDSLSIKERCILPNGHIMRANWIIKPIFAMR